MPTPYDLVSRRHMRRPHDVSGREFEEMCLIIYSHQYTDAMFYSRGHEQHGIDLKMREQPSYGPVRNVLVQCKDTKSLPASKIAPDIRAALNRWTPANAEDPDLLIVIASTVKQPDTDALSACFDEIVGELIAAPLRRKVKLLVHGWADLTRFVRMTPALSEYFLERWADDGAIESVEVERVGKCMRDCLDAGRMKEARQYWDLIQAKFAGVKLPADFSDNLVELFLRAGDFRALETRLDVLLATRRYRACYWVAYLRAKRFNSMVAPPRSFAEIITARPEPAFDLGATIRQQMEWLLPAQGSLDDTLTLAGWMVAYGARQAGVAGLMRSLSLIRQHWGRETGLPLPEPDECWTVHNGRLVPRAQQHPARWTHPIPTTPAERKAVVLIQAYEYVRLLFSTRFGYDSLRNAESECGGWCNFFDEDHDVLSVEQYFHRFGACGFETHAAKNFNEAGLAGFYAEAKRLHFSWDETDMVYLLEQHSALPYSAVCTSDVLLADCEHEYTLQRREDSLLSSPTLSIERVLAAMRMVEILDDNIGRSAIIGTGNVHSKRLGKLRELVRGCWLEQRRVGTRDVLVKPVYQDAACEDEAAGTSLACGKSSASWRVTGELRAAIALSNSGSTPLITRFSDYERSQNEGANCVRLPWRLRHDVAVDRAGWLGVTA